VPLLVLTGQEPELFLRRIAASALSDIAKHDPELAQAVVDAGMARHEFPALLLWGISASLRDILKIASL
jgi:3-methyladenine DNA glycosylase AlkC